MYKSILSEKEMEIFFLSLPSCPTAEQVACTSFHFLSMTGYHSQTPMRGNKVRDEEGRREGGAGWLMYGVADGGGESRVERKVI